MLRWSLTDLFCNTVGFFDQRVAGSNVLTPISSQGRAQLTVSLEDPLAHQVVPLGTALYVTFNDTPIFHGPILDPVYDGEAGTAALTALDPSHWLDTRFKMEDETRTGPPDGIVRYLVDSPVIDVIEGINLKRVLNAIEFDYASSLLELPPITQDLRSGTSFWRLVQEVSDLLDGVETLFEAQPPDQAIAAWAKLRLSKKFGTNKHDEIKFQYKFGQNNAKNYVLTPLGSSTRNVVTGIGQSSAESPIPPVTARHTGAIEKIGSWGSWETTNFSSIEGVIGFVALRAAAYGLPLQSFKITPAMEWMKPEQGNFGKPPIYLEDYTLGDTVLGEGVLGKKKYSTPGRIISTTFTEVDAFGNVQMDHDCIPLVLASGLSID